MDLSLNGKTALVTGGSKGIGKGIAEALVAEGCNVAICARHADELQKTADDLARPATKVLPVVADLTKHSDITHLVDKTTDALGSIDILVNNAGTVGPDASFEEMDTDAWRSLFELNVFAVITLCQAVLPGMKKQGWGRIINISSENGEQPYPDMMAYSATKGALNNITKSLSKAYGGDGILVNAVSPAFIRTPLVENMMQEQAEAEGMTKEEVIQHFLDNNRPHIELNRPGQVDEVGPMVAFLASEKASFVNGANIRIDGGSVAAI